MLASFSLTAWLVTIGLNEGAGMAGCCSTSAVAILRESGRLSKACCQLADHDGMGSSTAHQHIQRMNSPWTGCREASASLARQGNTIRTLWELDTVTKFSSSTNVFAIYQCANSGKHSLMCKCRVVERLWKTVEGKIVSYTNGEERTRD